MPQVVVIAGPNGAGKTTVSKTLLSEILHSKAFVNADAIAQGLNGLAPDTQAFQAGRLMLKQLDGFAEAGEDFAFETTLSGRTYAAWLRNLREEGYQVFLFYSWLNSADLAIERVRIRVQTGGHSIPEPTIRSRYVRSWDNFLRLYQPIADEWRVVDNSYRTGYQLVAEGTQTLVSAIHAPETWAIFSKGPTT